MPSNIAPKLDEPKNGHSMFTFGSVQMWGVSIDFSLTLHYRGEDYMKVLIAWVAVPRAKAQKHYKVH